MTPSEPQAGQQLWRVETRMLAGTVQDYEITELVAPTGDRFQDFAPSLVSMLNDAALRADVLAEALERVEGYVGCGDNSCLFKKPTGMATNGGCRCVRSGRPGVAPALAELYKAVALLAPKAAGGA